MKYLMEPQPRAGVGVTCISSGDEFYYHAMEIGQGYESEFFRCPAGVPDGVQKDDDGRWYWIVDEKESAQ